ncbi:hypothetical protein EXN66_Car010607 [Channa argus]|uniref:Uncharacterized protein n=1 Tax=Channa argus TaxID=215402 RepID=A0A6G1PX62_CHAAH|nr:hypothetical protein EXN66_Car010607 [Channa argus]
MTAFSGHTFLTQQGDSTGQIKELQDAIHENSRKLEAVQQQRLRVEEDISQCTKETKQRVELMMDKTEVVDVLQHLGHLLQEEKHLSEQLNSQVSVDSDLQEKIERFTTKARNLTAEIVEVKRRLAEAKARNVAAEALIHAPTRIKAKSSKSRF